MEAPPRNGPKEIVSSGVTGLYDKLKRGFGGGTPVKEGKGRPKSSASKESVDAESVLSTGSLKAVGLGAQRPLGDAASVKSSTSVTASPTQASFASNGAPFEPDVARQ